jgi:hypothetical protein
MMRAALRFKPIRVQQFSTFAVQQDDSIFKQPLEDFEFDSAIFAKPAFAKVNALPTSVVSSPSLKDRLRVENDHRLAQLHKSVNQNDSSATTKLASCIEPFDLVKYDLDQTKAFAI